MREIKIGLLEQVGLRRVDSRKVEVRSLNPW